MSMLAFTPDRNIKKADWSGVFLPAAKRFLAHHGMPPDGLHQLELQPNQQTNPDAMLEMIGAATDLEAVAVFCHGFRDRIQLGSSTRTVRRLAKALAAVSRKDLRVILYACSTALGVSVDADGEGVGGDGGFADALPCASRGCTTAKWTRTLRLGMQCGTRWCGAFVGTAVPLAVRAVAGSCSPIGSRCGRAGETRCALERSRSSFRS